jgi:site-specific recombinase XerD
VIARAGTDAASLFRQFLDSGLSNPNTRSAYRRAIDRFFDWCSDRGHERLDEIEPGVVAAYLRQHRGSEATVQQHLSALRTFFDAFVRGGILRVNPASSVRAPRAHTQVGATPVLSPEQTRSLLRGIDPSTVLGLRDRAVIGVMVYGFARVGAVVGMRRGDYFEDDGRTWLRLRRWTGRIDAVPAHRTLERYLDAYVESARIADPARPLFRSVDRHRRLSEAPLTRTDVLRMVKRRARSAKLPPWISCRTFRASGITAYLDNGGTLENAQRIAGHQSLSTTRRYAAVAQPIAPAEVDRIGI